MRRAVRNEFAFMVVDVADELLCANWNCRFPAVAPRARLPWIFSGEKFELAAWLPLIRVPDASALKANVPLETTIENDSVAAAGKVNDMARPGVVDALVGVQNPSRKNS